METSVNNKCKAFTSLEQAKKLAEILPIESADCFWDYDDLQKYHRINWFEDGYEKDSQLRLNKNNVCAWSLAALLDVLPNDTNIVKEEADTENEKYMCTVGIKDDIISTFADNPVDACVITIEKLHELKML